MDRKEMMHAMSVQEVREINGGSLNAPGLLQIISDAVKGIFTVWA